MSTYVMVHGAWCASWCWEDVVPGLEAAGHKVICVDLPGHGEDKTPIETVNLDIFVEGLAKAMEPIKEKVILAAHSMGGIVISQYAELHPEKVDKLFYIAAFMLRDGECQFDRVKGDEYTHITDESSEITEQGVISLKQEFGRDIGFAESSVETMMRAAIRMQPDSVVPWQKPLHLTEANYGSIPRYYLHTTNDHAISIQNQRDMVAKQPCVKVYETDGDHAVWYSRPQAVIDALLDVAE